MRTIRRVVALLAAILPAAAMAQAPQANTAYLSAEIGNGKVGLRCPAVDYCSREALHWALRAGYRVDASWAVEVKGASIGTGFSGWPTTTEYTGVGLGAAYTLPLSPQVHTLLRFGGAFNRVEYQPDWNMFFDRKPDSATTRSVKPYVGLGLSWQFARHWSTSLNADWTWADMRYVANGPKERVGVRTLGAGIAFHF